MARSRIIRTEGDIIKKSTLKTRSDGRLVKSITDPRTGKRVYFYGHTEREINKKIMEYSAKSEKGRTFAEVAADWWEEAESDLAYQSIKTYKPAMKRVLAEFGGDTMKDIRAQDINLFLKRLARQGLAAKTISNQRLVCNLIMTYGVLHGDIDINPCASVSTPPAKKSTRTAASSADEEIIKKSFDIWLFPTIALYTGMRKGEILALQWKDIDFNGNIISVTKSVYHEGDRPYIKSPKTEAGNRIVPLLKPLKAILENVSNKCPENYIISDDGQSPLTNRRFITLSKHYKEETGVTCTAHQLRHSFATIAFESDVPVKSVQEILGHKQLSTTMDIYTDFRKKSIDAAADILNSKI